MQFEEFDNKIREAADNHHPAYDENAWARMEKLLDKHLPQEDDRRRRIILFLLFFLLLGGAGIWLFNSKPGRGNKQSTTASTTIQKPTGSISTPVSSNMENTNDENNKLQKEAGVGVNAPVENKTITNSSTPDQIAVLLNSGYKKDRRNNTPVIAVINNKKSATDQPVLNINNKPEPAVRSINLDLKNKDHIDAVTTNTTSATLISGQNKNKKDVVADKNGTTITTNTKPVVNDPPAKENTNKDNKLLAQNPPDKKVKGKNKKGNTFFFTLSAGPDVSASGSDPLGKTKLLVGGGLGYTFKDRLTVRSGFYTARKIYTSSPGSYHPPDNFWSYYPNLQKVDADCKVYEIPLFLSYNFGHSSKQNWFASTGLSSYLMKKETYRYYYKNSPTGPTYSRQYTPTDKNNNYFSVLTLSGGYQKNIGKSFSVMVEPYIKVPFGGVGLGKVKLNSGGLLFSVAIKPFAGSGKHSNSHH